MALNLRNKITTSIFGRRLGLQAVTSAISGSANGIHEFLVGPGDIRVEVTTNESTATNVKPFGVSNLPGTSAASSAVYTLDPPIPGVVKTITTPTDNGPVYLKTANSETILTTAGSSFTTIKASSLGGAFQLMGYTTSQWLGFALTSGTSSQAGGFTLSTST